ncbi:MAG: hypothetical protein AB1831_13695 [Pseudomonadota bacterium]
MSESHQDNVVVTVVSGIDNTDRISLQLGEGMSGTVCTLTPSQARMLATELIAAVNRAEVKASLKSGTNMWRRTNETRPRFATAG